MTRTRFILLVAALCGAAPAGAQVMALSPTTMIGYAGTSAAGQQARRQLGSRLATRAVRPTASGLSSTPAAAASLRYRPDAAVRQQVYGRAIAQIERSSPGDAALVRRQLTSGAVRREVSAFLGRYGMSADDVADTTALYLASAWLASRGSAGNPSAAQMRGLRAQVAASMGPIAQAGNATKAEIAEANIVQTAFTSNAANDAAKDPSYAPKVRAAVVKAVRDAYQMDLSQLDLTAQGLR